MRPLIVLLGLPLALAACAPVGEETSVRARDAVSRQCFDINRVDNFRSGGWDTLYVRTQPDRTVYELTGVGCRDLDFAFQLGLAPDGLVGQRVCVGDRVRVINPSASPGQSLCRVRIDRALTTAEVEALPSAQRP